MLLQTEAISGPAYEYKEHHLLVRLLTREQGRVAVAVAGGRSNRGGRGGALEPLTRLEVMLSRRGEDGGGGPGRTGGDVWSLREATVLDSHDALRARLDLQALGSFLLDVALEAAPEGAGASELYDMVSASLCALEVADGDGAVAVCAWGLLHVLRGLGVAPQIESALLNGGWKQGAGATGGQGTGARGEVRKPRAFVLWINEGLITAAPGETGSRRENDGAIASEPQAYFLAPEAVRLVHANQTGAASPGAVCAGVSAAHAAQLIRALAALAGRHLEIAPRSLRFLEQTVLVRFRSTDMGQSDTDTTRE